MRSGRSAPVSINSLASFWTLVTLCLCLNIVREGSGAAIGGVSHSFNVRFGRRIQGEHIAGGNLWRGEVSWSGRASGLRHSISSRDDGDLPIVIPGKQGRDNVTQSAKGESIGIPTISNAKEEVEGGATMLLVEGSGFKNTANLQCRMSGLEAAGSVIEKPRKTRPAVLAIFVNEKLIKCAFSEELHNMTQVVVEVSNDGKLYSRPVVYHPQHSLVAPLAPASSSLPPVPGPSSGSSEAGNKDVSGNQGSEVPTNKANPKTKTTSQTKGKLGKVDDKRGTDKSTSTSKGAPPSNAGGTPSGTQGKKQRHGYPLQSALDVVRGSPHVSGILAGVMGLVLVGSFYWLWSGRRRAERADGVDPDVAYARVRTSEVEAGAASANGAGGNNNAFGVYDEEEEQDVGGWGDWDEEWERDEEVGGQEARTEKDVQANEEELV